VVLTTKHDASAASLSPVVSTLRDVASRFGDTATRGLAPNLVIDDPTGWIPAGELMSGDGLTNLLATAEQRWQAQPHVAAALAWKCYSYWLALPALIGFASARRVPLPALDDVFVRYSEHQPFLRLALRQPFVAVLPGDALAGTPRPGILVRSDEKALLDELKRALVDDHLDALMSGIRGRVHLGKRTLWGSLASGVAHALYRAADSVPGPILPMIDTVLGALGIDDLVDITTDPATGGLHIARRTCCLAFTLPEPKVCRGCCIR
jgi:hypothetical protein